jgi:hypothetical protein
MDNEFFLMGISLGATWANKGSTGAEPLHPSQGEEGAFLLSLAASLSLCKGPEIRERTIAAAAAGIYVGEKRKKTQAPFCAQQVAC